MSERPDSFPAISMGKQKRKHRSSVDRRIDASSSSEDVPTSSLPSIHLGSGINRNSFGTTNEPRHLQNSGSRRPSAHSRPVSGNQGGGEVVRLPITSMVQPSRSADNLNLNVALPAIHGAPLITRYPTGSAGHHRRESASTTVSSRDSRPTSGNQGNGDMIPGQIMTEHLSAVPTDVHRNDTSKQKFDELIEKLREQNEILVKLSAQKEYQESYLKHLRTTWTTLKQDTVKTKMLTDQITAQNRDLEERLEQLKIDREVMELRFKLTRKRSQAYRECIIKLEKSIDKEIPEPDKTSQEKKQRTSNSAYKKIARTSNRRMQPEPQLIMVKVDKPSSPDLCTSPDSRTKSAGSTISDQSISAGTNFNLPNRTHHTTSHTFSPESRETQPPLRSDSPGSKTPNSSSDPSNCSPSSCRVSSNNSQRIRSNNVNISTDTSRASGSIETGPTTLKSNSTNSSRTSPNVVTSATGMSGYDTESAALVTIPLITSNDTSTIIQRNSTFITPLDATDDTGTWKSWEFGTADPTTNRDLDTSSGIKPAGSNCDNNSSLVSDISSSSLRSSPDVKTVSAVSNPDCSTDSDGTSFDRSNKSPTSTFKSGRYPRCATSQLDIQVTDINRSSGTCSGTSLDLGSYSNDSSPNRSSGPHSELSQNRTNNAIEASQDSRPVPSVPTPLSCTVLQDETPIKKLSRSRSPAYRLISLFRCTSGTSRDKAPNRVKSPMEWLRNKVFKKVQKGDHKGPAPNHKGS